MTKSRVTTAQKQGDLLVAFARTVGTALGAVAAKISVAPKVNRPIAGRGKSAKSANITVGKRSVTGVRRKTRRTSAKRSRP